MSRLEQQLQFLFEIDRLKQVLRATRLLHPHGEESRFENSAEHSWHIALMAVVLQEHSNAPVDLPRVLKMLLIHDVVEIDAGDTPAFGAQGDKPQVLATTLSHIASGTGNGRSAETYGGLDTRTTKKTRQPKQ